MENQTLSLTTDDGAEVQFDSVMDDILNSRPGARISMIDKNGLPNTIELNANSLDELIRMLDRLCH